MIANYPKKFHILSWPLSHARIMGMANIDREVMKCYLKDYF